jgi:hypothetical protein
MVVPFCPVCMMLAPDTSLAILKLTLLNPHTHVIREQGKDDIRTWGNFLVRTIRIEEGRIGGGGIKGKNFFVK